MKLRVHHISPLQRPGKRDVCRTCNLLELYNKGECDLSQEQLGGIASHKAVADSMKNLREACKQAFEIPGWGKNKYVLFEFDYGESICLPLLWACQVGDAHFLNIVKVHVFCIKDHTLLVCGAHDPSKCDVKKRHVLCACHNECQCPVSRHCYAYDERSCEKKSHSVHLSMLYHFLITQHGPIEDRYIVTFCDGANRSNISVRFVVWFALVSRVHWVHAVTVSGHGHGGADSCNGDVRVKALHIKNIFDMHGLEEAWAKAARRARAKGKDPIAFHICQNSEFADVGEPLGEYFVQLPPNILNNYFLFIGDADHPGELGVCRSAADLCAFADLPLLEMDDWELGSRRFRFNLLKTGISAEDARAGLRDMFMEAPMFDRKCLSEEKQEALLKFKGDGKLGRLIGKSYDYFYARDYQAP